MTFKKGNKNGKDPVVEEVKDQVTQQDDIEGQESSTAAVPVGKSLHQQLAEMYFYDSCGIEMPYEGAPAEDRRKYENRSRITLQAIEKLNMMVVPRVDLNALRLTNKHGIMDCIRSFLESMNKPKDLAVDFPIEELAIRIMEGRTV